MKLLFNHTIFLIIFTFFSLNNIFANTLSLREDIDEEMLFANYWLTNNSQELLMNAEEIQQYNKNLANQFNIILSLTKFTDIVRKQDLYQLINIDDLKKLNLFKQKIKLNYQDYNQIIDEMNLEALKDNSILEYGVIVHQSHLKTYPTSEEILDSSGIAQWNETSISIGMPVVIIHHSKNLQFSYILMKNYHGWVLTKNIATTSKKDWGEYLNAYNNNFLIITANRIRLTYNPYYPAISELELTMGTKLTLLEQKIPQLIDQQSVNHNYVVKIPIRKENASLAYKLALISPTVGVNEGYLALTEANIIQQAFKMQGDRYDWGGSHNFRDSSAFIQDIYSVFGLHLPKQLTGEVVLPTKIDIKSTLSYQDRQEIITKLKPGAILITENHVALYLGSSKSKSYIIHAIGNEYINKNPITINQVMVTTTDLQLKNNSNLLNDVKSILYLK